MPTPNSEFVSSARSISLLCYALCGYGYRTEHSVDVLPLYTFYRYTKFDRNKFSIFGFYIHKAAFSAQINTSHCRNSKDNDNDARTSHIQMIWFYDRICHITQILPSLDKFDDPNFVHVYFVLAQEMVKILLTK